METFKLFPQFDIGVIGEGEDTIIELLHCLSRKEKSLTSINGIIFRNNDGILKTDDKTTLVDMDRLPLPAWDLLPSFPNAYRMSIAGTTSNKSTSIITSRGCPGKCTFCDKSVFGSKFRAHNADYVIRMFEYLINNYGIKDFIVCDENFTVDHKRLKQIYQTLIKNNYNITWSCAGRVDMVNPEILKLMKKAGCWQMAYDIESGSPRILKIMKKTD